MGKIRIYELARELNMTNKQLLEKLEELGIPVKSHMSSVEESEVDGIKAKIRGKKQPELVEKRIRPSVIRRRRIKKAAKPTPEAAEPELDQVAEGEKTAADVETEPEETPEAVKEAEKEAPEKTEAAEQAESAEEKEAVAEAEDTTGEKAAPEDKEDQKEKEAAAPAKPPEPEKKAEPAKPVKAKKKEAAAKIIKLPTKPM